MHHLSPEVDQSAFDRKIQDIGIVHFGLGAFTRAHQAIFTDCAMAAGDAGWMITGVSLRSTNVAEQLNPQDGLYLIAEQSGEGTRYRLSRAIREVLATSENTVQIIDVLTAPAVKIVSFTVTEKGYCRAPDGSLDLALADQSSFYPLLAKGFRARRNAGHSGLTLLSCDNLAENGRILGKLVSEYLAARAPDLLIWYQTYCTSPSTMVDRIVPATTDADRDCAETMTGLRDEALVMCEPFTQWVIEDDFASGRPHWENSGVQMVRDVSSYETAKLRMLNGAHSLLAYCGLNASHQFVHQAIADPCIRELVRRLMNVEAAPTINAEDGQDLRTYADTLIHRFENPKLNHQLSQIAADGSQKIPQRWLETLSLNGLSERSSPAILTAIAAWLKYVRDKLDIIDDPLAAQLSEICEINEPEKLVLAIFGPSGLLASDWTPTDDDIRFVVARLVEMQ
ncbi:mannitol dehydrogenase family protein [Parasphingorhabdus cellanae]|uniref:Mannitol dehydrogenase family protein n=1 Tax=Parasphingorhabdus cellanae TaxID=2806553 RepID=A0ABX7T8H3_9SPHN|nr:mannitol dehydrogenase family protein [Parasphingorhabdus cellanae]